MKANLSLVLDEFANRRFDILENVELSEIDKYTTKFNDSDGIREDNKNVIDKYLDLNSYYLRNVKNKNGSIVITYIDEYNKVRRLKVLYKKHSKRLNPDSMIKNIRRVLKVNNDPKFTIQFIQRFTPFIFGSPFEKRILNDCIKAYSYDDRNSEKINKKLVDGIIGPNLRNTLSNDEKQPGREKCYFHIRLLDAFLHKNKIETTKDFIDTKNGKIEASKDVPLKTVVKKKNNHKNIVEDIYDKDGDYYIQGDGQYSFVDSNMNQVVLNDSLIEDIEEYEQEFLVKENVYSKMITDDSWDDWKEEEETYER